MRAEGLSCPWIYLNQKGRQMRIIDINLHPDPQLILPPETRRRFLILAKAFSLGLIDTDGSLADLMLSAESMTDPTISDILARIVIAEGPYAQHTI
jgi:hypothetical protein